MRLIGLMAVALTAQVAARGLAQGNAAPVCAVIQPDANDGVLVAPENHKVLYEDADVWVIAVTVVRRISLRCAVRGSAMAWMSGPKENVDAKAT